MAFEEGEDRNRLVEHLESTYDLVASDSCERLGEGFDCCLVDAATFARSRDRIADRRAAVPATPVLLVTSPEHLDRGEARIWTEVDEILTTPVRQAELRARIEGLVERYALVRGLARSESRFRTLFETAPDPVVVFDADGTVEAVNDAFCETTGVESDDASGRSLADLPALPAESADRLLATVDGAHPDSFDHLRYRSADGTTRFANARVNRMTADDDSAQYVAVLRDVTERVHRTRELERQNDRLGEFAQIVSHELRNPLNIAEGRLSLARERLADADRPAVEDDLRRVDDAHQRIARMISELLTLSRQGDAIGEIETAAFESVVEDAWAETPTGDATLAVESADASITADLERVKDVFRNLFRNAVEHSSTGSQTKPDDAVEHGSTNSRPDGVTVRVGPLDDDGFYVEDDGSGIPPGERDRVFEAGYTTTDDGTGFGLAIVDQIVSAHGWDVAVVTGTEGGARFEITGFADAMRDAVGE